MTERKSSLSRRDFIKITSAAVIGTIITPVDKVIATVDLPLDPVINKNEAFSQRCTREGSELVCDEEWAEKPLPGGCYQERQNYMGGAGCTAASIALVANRLLSQSEIIRITNGESSTIEPDFIIESVYPNMDEKSVLLTCGGTSSPTIIAALEHLGLEVLDKPSVSHHKLGSFKTPDTEIIVGFVTRVKINKGKGRKDEDGDDLEANQRPEQSHFSVYHHVEDDTMWCDDSSYPTDETGRASFDIKNDFKFTDAIVVTKSTPRYQPVRFWTNFDRR